MRTRRWFFGLALLLAMFAPAALRGQAPRVGFVDFVAIWGTRAPVGQNWRPAYEQDGVAFRDQLATVEGGAMHIRLVDETVLRLGSDARVVLDEYVYDPGRGAAAMTATVTLGIARFITGKLGPGMTVRTPTAVIGVRGTDFSVWVEQPSGRTTIWVNEGTIQVTPGDGQAVALVGPNETVAVAGQGAGVQRNASRPPADPGLADELEVRRFFR